MVTGDNVRTAISVGRECGMISQTCRVYLPTFLKGSLFSPPFHERLANAGYSVRQL